MWINKETGSIIEEENMYEVLMEIAELHSQDFDPTDMLNELYPSITYFGEEFFAGDIIRELDPYLFNECWNEQYRFWTEHMMDNIEHLVFEEEDNLLSISDFQFEELKNIIWKND